MTSLFRGGLIVFLLLAGWGRAQEEEPPDSAADDDPKAEEQRELPDWEEEELEDLEAGDYVPGSSLIGRLAREALESDENEVIEMPEAVRELPEGENPAKQVPSPVPDEVLDDYFRELPQGLLNDPQDLLTEQESRDRRAFLGYHKEDVGITFYLYLFDHNQYLPDGLGPVQVMQSQLKAEEPAVVVFYYLGAPEKAGLAFSERVQVLSKPEDRKRILERAVAEGLQKSEAISQLEGFSIELSAGLARLERAILAGGKSLGQSQSAATGQDGAVAPEQAGWGSKLVAHPGLFWSVTGFLFVVLAGFLGWLGRYLAMKRRTCVFPDAEGSSLLEAPYAAGVGGVLSFSSANAPPSSQKKDLPDYLQRM